MDLEFRLEEDTGEYFADVGRVSLRLSPTRSRWEWTAGVIGPAGALPDGWAMGEVDDLEAAKEAAVEAAPQVLAAVTAWMYEGAPPWILEALAPPEPPRVENRVSLCKRLEETRGVFMKPELVGREVVALTPTEEDALVETGGAEALVRHYCPHDPRLREIRPKAGGEWFHVRLSKVFTIIGIGRFQSSAHRVLDMAEIVMYGNPGNPLISLRPLDEFMDGRFIPKDTMFGVNQMVEVTEDHNLVPRGKGDGMVGRACRNCGAFVGDFHMFGCAEVTA